MAFDDVYDDGSEVLVTTDPEDCPTGDDYVDAEQFGPTDDEVTMGDVLGETIDIDNDLDNGARTVEAIDELTR